MDSQIARILSPDIDEPTYQAGPTGRPVDPWSDEITPDESWDLLSTTDGGKIIADLTDRELRALAIRAWDLSNTHDLEALRAEGRRRGFETV